MVYARSAGILLGLGVLAGILGASSCVGEDASSNPPPPDAEAANEAGTPSPGVDAAGAGDGGPIDPGNTDGGQGFAPTNLASCALWLRADLGLTVNAGNEVTAWADQSKEGDRMHDLVSSANLPTLGAINGKPAVVFTSNDPTVAGGSHMKSGVFTSPLASPVTYYAAFRTPATFGVAADGVVFDGLVPLRHKVAVYTTNPGFEFAGNGLPTRRTLPVDVTDRTVLLTVVYDRTKGGSLLSVHIAGAPRTGESFASIPSFTELATQGQMIVGASRMENQNLQGSLAEIIAFRAAHGPDTRAVVESYLAARYGLP